jgi:hypothetical protein
MSTLSSLGTRAPGAPDLSGRRLPTTKRVLSWTGKFCLSLNGTEMATSWNQMSDAGHK